MNYVLMKYTGYTLTYLKCNRWPARGYHFNYPGKYETRYFYVFPPHVDVFLKHGEFEIIEADIELAEIYGW